MHKFARLGLILALLLSCCTAISWAQTGGAPSASSSNVSSSIVLLQSEIGGHIVNGTAFVITSGESCLALTSYEAVKGAAVIRALIPKQGLVMAHLTKFAPDTNLAVIEIAAPNLPAVKIGDYQMLRPKMPLELVTCSPIMDGNEAFSFTSLNKPCTLQSAITRPSGVILRVTFNPGIIDETSGAPIINPSTGEVVAVSLSLAISQIDTLRFAIPAGYVNALCPELGTLAETNVNIRVLDGSQAPVLADDPDAPKKGLSTGVVVAVILGVLVILGVVAKFMLKGKKEKFVPFSNLPLLPDGVAMAFVTDDGKILPSDAEVIKIGRADGNTWQFSDPTVSNNHARIQKNKATGKYEVKDLGSTNGTFVGKRKIVSTESVPPGTIIRFGKKLQVMLMTRMQAVQQHKQDTPVGFKPVK